jgi:photosystem II stability/assembly factor-like uncharacterized protein
MISNLALIVASAGRGIRIARRAESDWTIATVLSDQDVRCVAVHPDDATRWYAGTQGNGLFETTDSGASWSSAGLEGRIIKSVVVAPDAIYAGTKPASVYASIDAGRTWSERENFKRIPGRQLWWSPAESPGTAYVQSLAVSPSDPKVLLAGIEFGAVVRSQDEGETWSRHLKGSLRDCHTMKFHTSEGSWAYEAGGTGGGASVSMDGGVTWQKVKDGLDRHYGVACAADPDEPDVWYVSVSPGPGKAHSIGNAQGYIFRTRKQGSWERMTGGLPQPFDSMPYGLATVPGRPGLIIGALKNGQVWASEDQGDSWNHLPVELGPIGLGLVAQAD